MVLVACSRPDTQAPAEMYLTGTTMGVIPYNVKFVNNNDVDTEQLHQLIDQRLQTINQLMSTYVPNSELSLLNQSPADTPTLLSRDTAVVIEEALRLGTLTDGALNVTLGPLINLWGFGPGNRPKTTPSQAQIDAAMSITGLVHIDLQGQTIRKAVDELYIDLSPIAKGYAVDEVAHTLEQQGIADYLVEIGGEMRLAGVKANGQAWRVAIEKPISTQRAIQKIISIGNNAIATSGDYRNYFEEDGVRYSHLINPNTGYPIAHNLVSVTVVHPSSMTADGLATGLSVMGTEAAIELAERENLSVLLISKDGDNFTEYQSQAFKANITIVK
jgi:thiamine biosynthesis lipoprotein